MVMRLRYEKRGGHYHVRLFTARGPGQTFANCGELCFDEREWPDVQTIFMRGGAELVPEGERSAIDAAT